MSSTKKFFILLSLSILVLIITVDAQTNWQQTKGPFGGMVSDIKADNKGNLYAASAGGLYTSSNEGENWAKICNSSMSEIFVHPSGIIFASGSGFLYEVEDDFSVTKRYSSMYSLQMDSKNNLYGRDYRKIYSSSDTAKTWNSLVTFPRRISSFFLYDDTTFFASADSGIYISRDCGKKWNYYYITNTSFGELADSKFAKDNYNNIYLMSFWDIFKSSDAGETWTKLKLPPNIPGGYNLFSIFLNKDNEIFVGSSDGILYSNDLGKTWKNIYFTFERVYGFCEDSSRKLFCASGDLGIYFFDRINNKMIIRNNGIIAGDILFLNKLNGYLICQAWSIGFFKSNDDGNTWTRLNNPGIYQINYVDKIGRIFASGHGKIFCSTNIGESWQTITLPDTNRTSLSIVSIDDNTIIAALDYKSINNEYFYDIIRSEDFGKTWEKVFTHKDYISHYHLDVYNDIVYLSLDKLLYSSKDLGKNWELEKEFSSDILVCKISTWGNLCVGTYEGLYVKDLVDWKYIDVPWRSPIVFDLYFSSKGEMFVLAFDLWRSTDRGKSYQLLPGDFSVSSARGLLIDDGEGKIYAASTSHGIFVSDYTFASTGIPTSSSLYYNYPNPFNNQTTIEFYLQQPGDVNLSIFNSIGQRVETLAQSYTGAGFYRINWQPKNLASGIYLYRLQTLRFTETKKMIYLK